MTLPWRWKSFSWLKGDPGEPSLDVLENLLVLLEEPPGDFLDVKSLVVEGLYIERGEFVRVYLAFVRQIFHGEHGDALAGRAEWPGIYHYAPILLVPGPLCVRGVHKMP